jgi:predicted nucleic acid-binding protein
MLVLDANILVRAVLGSRVPWLLGKYAAYVEFVGPDTVFRKAREELPAILERRGVPADTAMAAFGALSLLVQTIEFETYSPFEPAARQRLARRDEDDWPVLAVALALNCPIWTEDNNFFGCGVATWTTDRVELYMADELSASNVDAPS